VYVSFVDAEAVPKKILELMNVPGLTRENVASHLQVWNKFALHGMFSIEYHVHASFICHDFLSALG